MVMRKVFTEINVKVAPGSDRKNPYDPSKRLVLTGIANATIVDRANEIMPKECWDLANYLKNPIVLINHDYSKAVGISIAIQATEEGLVFEAIVGDPEAGHPLTSDQIECRSLLAQKILRAFSVGFIPHSYTEDETTGVITFTKAELLEISIVSIPMQQDSLITSLKAKEMKIEKKDSHDAATTIEKEIDPVLVEMMAILKEISAGIASLKDDAKPANPTDEPTKALNGEVTALKAQVSTLTNEKTELESTLKEFTDLMEGT